MKKYFGAALCGLVTFILNLSCQKEAFNPFTDPGYSEKSFSFTNTGPVEVKTPTGLKISFPANAFVKENGQPATGTINLLVKEILRPDAMILHNKTTMSNGIPLESGGEFYVHATSGNDVLRLAPNTSFSMELPKSSYSRNSMRVFNGIEDMATGNVNWQANVNPAARVSTGDSSGTRRGAVLFSDSIEWINCDRFINEPLITLDAIAGNCPDVDSTSVYVHLTDRNSVLELSHAVNLFTSSKLIAVPATIIGICSKNGNLSASFNTVNMSNGRSITLNFSPITQQSLRSRLAVLQ